MTNKLIKTFVIVASLVAVAGQAQEHGHADKNSSGAAAVTEGCKGENVAGKTFSVQHFGNSLIAGNEAYDTTVAYAADGNSFAVTSDWGPDSSYRVSTAQKTITEGDGSPVSCAAAGECGDAADSISSILSTAVNRRKDKVKKDSADQGAAVAGMTCALNAIGSF